MIGHEALGYYGITLNRLECKVNGKSEEPLGRFTMGGDVENWQPGGPGKEKLKTIEMCNEGVAPERMIQETIHHFRLEPLPIKTHLQCRHKRRGSSYQLCFELATIVALIYEDQIQISNHPMHTHRELEASDPEHSMKEHPGAFAFKGPKGTLLVAGDGRLLDCSDTNIWLQYMQGTTVQSLLKYVTDAVGARKLPTALDAAHLLSFLPQLYSLQETSTSTISGITQGKNSTYSFPWHEYPPVVERFFAAISAEQWCDYDYVPERTEEDIKQAAFIEQANLEQIVTLLTYCQRGEKFCDGHWSKMLEQGYIMRILKRLESLFDLPNKTGENRGGDSLEI